jgi:hypothetical protein
MLEIPFSLFPFSLETSGNARSAGTIQPSNHSNKKKLVKLIDRIPSGVISKSIKKTPAYWWNARV